MKRHTNLQQIALAVCIAVTLLPLIMGGSPTSALASGNPFGLMIGAPGMGMAQRLKLARQMGAAYFRPGNVSVEDWNGTCPDCGLLKQSGLKAVLTVRNSGSDAGRVPSSPPSDLDTYERKLGDVLDKYGPQVLTVENEENSELSYSGTPEQYGIELTVACDAAHRRNVPCTNGGLTSEGLALLTWANYVDSGNRTQACDFARRAFSAAEAGPLCRLTSTAALPPRLRRNLDESRNLLQAYRSSGVDYVNFHWHVADGQAMQEAVSYLREATGLPLLSNEIGQMDASPDTVRNLMKQSVDLDLRVVVWFALDRRAQGLVEPDGSLRPSGQAFVSFIRERFGAANPPQPQGSYAVAAPFAAYYGRVQGPKVLGPPIGPMLNGVQYFEKGRLEDQSAHAQGDWAFAYGLLVPELIRSGASVRVAGGAGPTYAELAPMVAVSARVQGPGGGQGLVVNGDGSAFVPFDPYLRGDRGHNVPSYFWSYMNSRALFPAGWLHDVGLPLSEPFTVDLNKAGASRPVTLQVFERTVLSYDPANPAGFQVERANTGLSYRDAFPGRVLGGGAP